VADQRPPRPPRPPRPAKPPRAPRPNPLAERPEVAVEKDERVLRAGSRRDFLFLALGAMAAAAGAWWLLPDRTKARLLPGEGGKKLDTLAARCGLSGARREKFLDRALTFDDDVAEALYSPARRVRTYARADASVPRNNYHGRTPAGSYLPGWTLQVSGLASGRTESLALADLERLLPRVEQTTRLVCVEGWSTVAWWAGFPFAQLLAQFPPAPSARWAALRSSVNLDARGNPDPYYVSVDLDTLRHPQTLLATHLAGAPLTLEHGAPLRLLAPVKLGLKNIKAVTHVEYTALQPPDYWNERGYSKYDGL